MVITMLNRARSISVAILGLGAMLAMHTVNRLSLARMHRKLETLRDKAAATNSAHAQSS
jgi:DNA-binding transcriptional regulator LsrR (DeoR family)